MLSNIWNRNNCKSLIFSKYLQKLVKLYSVKNVKTANSSDTVELAYASYESTEDTVSDQPPLVILHGLLGSKNNWNSMSKAIHKKSGRKVIAVDARNHGDSQHSSIHTYIHMAADVAALLKNLSIDKCALLGHSMGGRTAMSLSLLYPDMVASLVVVDISPVKTSTQLFSMMNILEAMTAVKVKAGIPISKARVLADEQLKYFIPDATIRNFVITNLVQVNNGSFKWRANVPVLRENFKKSIASFPSSLEGSQYLGPTLFIGGATSDYIGKDDLAAIKEYFPLADLTFVEGAGHWVHSEKPEIFLQKVCTFLKEK